ncbi:FG-GAP-like repeat-containing protein, partial [Actinoplanes sp. NPDC026623]|uniref:FG-GAP-like repeat-containing protein n=1 Tax=Actinoplanes sp. NPDC026623 TaxID=3155610 RepID=UPI0033F696E5
MNTSKIRSMLVAAAGITGIALGSTLAPVAALAAPAGTDIAAIAKRELNDSSRNYEIGTNCSYYGGEMFSWPACGGKSGWGGGGGAYAWCAAFAKYTWREGGVTSKMGEVTGMAESFRTYGKNNDTWHARGSYVPKKGDAVVFNHDSDANIDHVGIVTSVSGSNLVTIEGNSSDRVSKHTYYRYAENSAITGFTTPLGVNASEPAPEPEPEPWTADVTGDGFHDMVAIKTDGTMMLYSNNIVRDNGTPYSSASSRQIGNGWDNFAKVIPADVTGDGFRDLLGVKADGTMWLYSNNIVRDEGDAYTASRQVGSGWNNYVQIIPADVTGDGFTDLVGVKADGTMWLYSNNIVRDNGTPYSSASSRQIGSGWGNFSKIMAADVTG